MLLEVTNLDAFYGDLQALHGLDMEVERGVVRERRQHVIQERLAGDDAGLRCFGVSRWLDPHLDPRFLGFAGDNGHSPNSEAAARGSMAPVYRAMPTIAAATPRSASARTSARVAIPPAA